jgi:hypothetical protein
VTIHPPRSVSSLGLNPCSHVGRRSARKRGNGPRPFSRIAIAHPDPLHAHDVDGHRSTPVALWYEGVTAESLKWRDLATSRPLRIRPPGTMLREADISAGGPLPVKTMRDVFARLAQRHDYGLDHAGWPTTRMTSGLVRLAPTNTLLVVAIGREATNLDRVCVTADPVYRMYVDPSLNPWTVARDTLRILGPGILKPGRPREEDKPFLIRRAGELARADSRRRSETWRYRRMLLLRVSAASSLSGGCASCATAAGAGWESANAAGALSAATIAGVLRLADPGSTRTRSQLVHAPPTRSASHSGHRSGSMLSLMTTLSLSCRQTRKPEDDRTGGTCGADGARYSS